MAEGFLGRWSQRKQALREGRPLEEPAPTPVPPSVPAGRKEESDHPAQQAATAAPPPQAAQVSGEEASAPPPPPTLQDVQQLTTQSDFTRYMKSDVDPEVKNAAMQKLFADPHFNVMDGLDIYIDDYNKPDPMPASMLRQLASAQFLNLFDEEKRDNPSSPTVRPIAAAPAGESTPSRDEPAADPAAAPISNDHDDDTDLRLQQDHAAGPQGSGRGSE